MGDAIVHLTTLKLLLLLLLLILRLNIVQFTSKEFHECLLLAERFDSGLAAAMVDVKEGKACEDNHDEECDDPESYLALLLWSQNTINLFLSGQVHL